MDKLTTKDRAKTATSGLTTSKGLGSKLRQAWRLALASGLSVSLVVVTMPVQANPAGGTVVSGSAVIDQSAPSTTTVTQSSDKAIIDWQSFNIGAGEQTNFVQPNSNSLTLNRVTGGEMSTILGQLTANGRIMLINSAGVLFGAGAKVDVGGLLATTADIENSDFMAGNYTFKQNTTATGGIINRGEITAKDNGLVALVAPGVENSGVIQANLGKVALAAGKSFTLDLYGDQLINLDASSVVTEKVKDEQGNAMKDGVRNSGSIIADGGKVLLTANVAKEVVDHAINMDGVIQARSVTARNGEIILLGGTEGKVRVSGKVDVSGKSANQKGGIIKVLGNEVALVDNAQFDASGDIGGGTILIGGNYQGKGLEQNAVKTVIEKDVTLNASALTVGDGGKVIVWSDGTTEYYGSIIAKGGAVSGNGGFVETSGKETLTIDATSTVNASAVNGARGKWLLDPTDVTIGAAEAASYMATLNGGTDVYVTATNDITVNSAITWNAASTLDLDAGNDILINAKITALGTDSGPDTAGFTALSNSDGIGGGDIVISADIQVDHGVLNLATNSGNLIFNGGNLITGTTSTYLKILSIDGNIILNQDASLSGKSFSITSDGVIGNNNDLDLNVNSVIFDTGNAGVDLGTGDLTINASSALLFFNNNVNVMATLNAGSVNFSSADMQVYAQITAAQDVTMTGGDIRFGKSGLATGNTINAGGDITLSGSSVSSDYNISYTGGNLSLIGQNVVVNAPVLLTSGNLFISSTTGSTYLGDAVNVNGNVAVFGNQYVYAEGDIVTTSGGNVTLHGNTDGTPSNRGVFLDGNVNSSGDIDITGEWSNIKIGDNVTLTGNNITLYGALTNAFGAAGPYTSNATQAGDLTINAAGNVLIFDSVLGINSLTLQNAAYTDLHSAQVTTLNNLTFNTPIAITNTSSTLTSLNGNVTINGATGNALTVAGGSGNNVFNLTNVNTSSLTIDGGTGTDVVNFAANSTAVAANFNAISNIEQIIGTAFNDTIIGANVAGNSWIINGSNSGTLNGTLFSSFENLAGGSISNSFNFTGTGAISGVLNGGSLSDTLTYAGYINPVAVTLTGANAGNGTGIGGGFISIENLVGSSNADTFTMNAGSSLDGTLNGGSANDSLLYTNYGAPVAITLTGAYAGNATGIAGGFSSIENLGGSAASDTLTGNNAVNSWAITGANAGNITGNVAFTGFENLVGGSLVDTFNMNAGSSLSGSLNGGSSNDSLLYTNYGSAVTITLTGANSGTATGITGGFASIENLTGSALADTFNMNAGGSLTGSLNGGSANDSLLYTNYGAPVAITLTGAYAGNATGITGGFSSIENLGGSAASDTLTGNNAANTWAITGANAGNITGNVAFTGFENLVGGSLVDTFNMNAGSSLSGSLNGGSANDSLLYTNYGAPVAIDLTGANSGTATGITGGFASIENLTGSALADTFSIGINGSITGLIDGGAGIDSLTAAAEANIWSLTGADSGDVNGNDYIQIENIIGGSDTDDFTLGINGSVSGLIDGGAGIDTLTAADEANIWNLTGADSGDVNGNDYIRIENIIGGSDTDDFTLGVGGSVSGVIDGGAGIDSLISTDGSDVWNITGTDSGDVNGNDFINIENISGGDGNDTFNLGDNGLISGVLDGGDGTDTLNISNDSSVWHLTGTNSGDVEGTDFINIENLDGGPNQDLFIIHDGGYTDFINGDTDEDTLDLRELPGFLVVDKDAGIAPGTGGFTSIENILLNDYTNDIIIKGGQPTQIIDYDLPPKDDFGLVIEEDGNGKGNDIKIVGTDETGRQGEIVIAGGAGMLDGNKLGNGLECLWAGILGAESADIVCNLELGSHHLSISQEEAGKASKLLGGIVLGLLAALLLWRYRSKWLGLLAYAKWTKAAAVTAVKEKKKRDISKQVKGEE